MFGAGGFIGGHLMSELRRAGHDPVAPDRDDEAVSGDLGHVIYAIGLTGSFRQRPYDTVEAHVAKLGRFLQGARFDSWLYLSSTRVYGAREREAAATEESEIMVRPSADSLYDLSKLLGEALCLAHPDDRVRVVRLSNVVGPELRPSLFLGAVFAQLAEHGTVEILESPESAKDYVSVEDVAGILPRISVDGRHRVYNVASGVSTSHRRVAELLNAAVGGRVTFAPGGEVRRFPAVSIDRLTGEFPEYRPRSIDETLEPLIARVRAQLGSGR